MKTMAFDAAAFLKTDEDIAAYLNEVMEIGDAALTAAALGDVARAKGMSKVAKHANKSREGLYRSLSKQGNPELETVTKVLGSFGMRLYVVPAKHAALTVLRASKKAKTKRSVVKTSRAKKAGRVTTKSKRPAPARPAAHA